MKKCTNRYIFWCVLFAVPLQGAGIDIFSPALPEVTRYFASTAVQLTIGFYLIGYGFGQIFCGPLTDAIGRKKVLIAGLALYVIASLLAAFAVNTCMLLIMRILQGIAIAAPAVVNRAIFADIYSHDKLPIKMNWFTTAWATGPVIAPFLGGYLTHYINWHATLTFLGIYALVMLILFTRVQETHPNATPISFKQICINYGSMLKHPAFMGTIFCIALLYGLILIFNVVAPFVFEHQLGLSPVEFGYVALFMGVGIFLGNVCNGMFIKCKIPQHNIVTSALFIGIISSLLMFWLGTAGIFNIAVIAIPMFVLFFTCGLFFGNLYGVPVRLFKHLGGSAGGLMGSLFLTMAGIIGAFASLLGKETQVPLALSCLIICLAALVIYWVFVRKVFTGQQ